VREETFYPTQVSRNPASTRVQAGLPAPGALGSPEASEHIETTRDLPADPTRTPRPGETEVIEDVYEET
jgi:hypothetical protein